MKCSSCGNDNKQGSRFCRHCGKPLGDTSSSLAQKISFEFLKKFKTQHYIIAVVCIFLFAGVAYGAVKGQEYFKVSAAISKAQQLNQSGDFKGALATLTAVKGDAVFASQKANLNNMIQSESTFITDANLFSEASTSIVAGDLQGAEVTLQSIPNTFPGYNKVQSEISIVQSEIENQLQNQTQQAEDQTRVAQAEQAKSEAAAAQAAKDKTQAEAAAAAAAQAQSQAAAAAATEAAAAAQAKANTEHQVLVSFYNQLQAIYSSVNGSGISDYNSGNTYYNEGTTLGDLDAIGMYGQAEAVENTAYTDATNLDNFTNMPASYVTAGENMATAANDCYQAASIAMTDAGNAPNGVYTSPNSYTSECNSLMTSVHLFLQTTTP